MIENRTCIIQNPPHKTQLKLKYIMKENNLGDVKYFIDHDKRILFAERHDKMSKEGIYAEWLAIRQIEGFEPNYDTIADYSSVTRIDLDASDVMELSREMPNHDPRSSNVAIIAGLLEGRYRLARFFCVMTNLVNKRKFQVFKTKSEAELWLFSQ